MRHTRSVSAILVASGVLATCGGSARADVCSLGASCCPNWITVFERSDRCQVSIAKGAAEIDALFEESLVLRYEIDGEAVAYFKREADQTNFNLSAQIFDNWVVEADDYGQGKHFVLYSTEDDLQRAASPWTYCPTQDNAASGLGIPGTCRASVGNADADADALALRTRDSCEAPKRVRISVCSYSNTNAPTTLFPSASPTELPSKTPTKSPTPFPTEFPSRSPTTFPTRLPSAPPTPAPVTASPTTRVPTGFPTSPPTSLAPTLTPTKTASVGGLCRQSLAMKRLEIGVATEGDAFCPGLVDFKIDLEHGMGAGVEIALEVSFSTTRSSSTSSTNDAWYSSVTATCTNSAEDKAAICLVPASGTPPASNWTLTFEDVGENRCTFAQTYDVTMPGAKAAECADATLEVSCADADSSLMSLEANFGSALAGRALALVEEDARLSCVVQNEQGDLLASLAVLVDSSQERITCGSGVVVRAPRQLYIVSDSWATPLYRQAVGDACSDAESNEGEGATPGADPAGGTDATESLAARVAVIVGIAVGGALALGILATLFVRLVGRLGGQRPRPRREDSWSRQQRKREREQQLAPPPGVGMSTNELVCSPDDVDLATFGHRNF